VYYLRSSFQKSFRGTCVDGCTKPATTFFYVNTYNAKRLSSWCKQHINILLRRKRSPCCPFFVVVASTFNTQRLPGLFHCGKRYRSARLYLYKSDAPVTNLHLLRSWKQVGSKFIFKICMGQLSDLKRYKQTPILRPLNHVASYRCHLSSSDHSALPKALEPKNRKVNLRTPAPSTCSYLCHFENFSWELLHRCDLPVLCAKWFPSVPRFEHYHIWYGVSVVASSPLSLLLCTKQRWARQPTHSNLNLWSNTHMLLKNKPLQTDRQTHTQTFAIA
jgi:hypothetical protein